MSRSRESFTETFAETFVTNFPISVRIDTTTLESNGCWGFFSGRIPAGTRSEACSVLAVYCRI